MITWRFVIRLTYRTTNIPVLKDQMVRRVLIVHRARKVNTRKLVKEKLPIWFRQRTQLFFTTVRPPDIHNLLSRVRVALSDGHWVLETTAACRFLDRKKRHARHDTFRQSLVEVAHTVQFFFYKAARDFIFVRFRDVFCEFRTAS
ncbi:hypothetical protein D3C87_1631400 [compost metagenome]